MINKDNSQKSQNGSAVKSSLSQLLQNLKDNHIIKKIIPNYSKGYPGKDPNQYKFDFLIEFNDGTSWIIKATSVIRSDRTKGVEHDAEHLRILNPNIENAFLVCPDNVATTPEGLVNKNTLSRQLRDGTRVSPLNNALLFKELEHLINAKSLAHLPIGTRSARAGLNLEERIVETLQNSDNKKRWNHNALNEYTPTTGYYYDWYVNILTSMGISSDDTIKTVHATTDIPKLLSKGQPKTDVFTEILVASGEVYTANFSCKNSTKKFVSIHQYSAESFINTLSIKEPELCTALKKFQCHGGYKELQKNSLIDFKNLELLLPKYKVPLIEWAYFGVGGQGTDIQIANYIISYNADDNTFSVYNRTEFIEKQKKINNQFNTPFMWTYASGQKGRSIQLKGRIN